MLKVIKDNYLVETLPEEEITKAGLIVPMVSKGGINKGIIVAVGTDKNLDEVVFVGSKIFFKKHMATEIKYDGKTYFVVKADCIIAVI